MARGAAPLYVTTLVASVGASVNVALLGRHDTAALAAFAVTLAIYAPAVATVAGVLRGMSPFVADTEGDPHELGRLVGTGVWLAVVVGGLGALAVSLAGPVGSALGVSGRTVDRLGAFPLVLAVAVLLVATSTSATSVLVALGRGSIVLRSGLVATGVTVGLSVVLVGAPGPLPSLGLAGAGIAIVGGLTCGALLANLALRRVPEMRGAAHWPGRPDVARMVRIARVGIPLAGTVLVKFGVLGVLTIAAARLGTGQAAVHGVAESLVNLIFTAAVAVGQTVVPLVAGHARAGEARAARRTVAAGGQVALAVVAVLCVTLVLGGRWVIPVFTDDPAVQDRLASLMPVVALVVLADAVQAVWGFGMVGLKRTTPSLVSTVLTFGALAALAVPIADRFGLTGLWVALAIANLVQAIAKISWFHRLTTKLDRRSTRMSQSMERRRR